MTFGLSWWQISNPLGGSVVIFTMYFLYLLITASLVPLVAGMFIQKAKTSAVTFATLASLLAFIITYFGKITFMSNNPAFLATVSILSAVVVFIPLQFFTPSRLEEENVENRVTTQKNERIC